MLLQKIAAGGAHTAVGSVHAGNEQEAAGIVSFQDVPWHTWALCSLYEAVNAWAGRTTTTTCLPIGCLDNRLNQPTWTLAAAVSCEE